MSKVDWFSRGRDAFTEGRPCFCQDARISSADRNAWYEGWKHQRNLNTDPATGEAHREALATIAEILQSIRDL